MLEGESNGKLYPSVLKKCHYTVTSEPGGQYVHHFTPEDATDEIPAPKQTALCLNDWVGRHGVDKTLVAIGGDSTNVNTGIDGGTFQFLEQLLDRNLIWLVCGLHLNELPLRHLITGLDGKTCSDTWFTSEVFSLKV
jgi:hypothetical protein